MKSNEKVLTIAEEYHSEIEKGYFGESGDLFLTTRELSAKSKISLEYANKVMEILSRRKIIMLVGKRFYITNGMMKIGSALHNKLTTKKSFGMLINNLQNVFVARLTDEVSNLVEKNGYSLIVRISNNISILLDEFLKDGVSGIFVDPYIAKNFSKELTNYPLPIVSLGFDITNINRDSITVDNYRAGKMVADYFLKTGCKKFAYFGFEETSKSDERLNGFRNQIIKSNRSISENNMFLLPKNPKGEYDIKLIKDAINKLIWKTSSYDKVGIFCYHDLIAYDVIDAIEHFDFLDKKRKIPDDFSVVGFDDLSIYSAIKPKLTTVSYPINEIASKGFLCMQDCINNKDHISKKQKILFCLQKGA